MKTITKNEAYIFITKYHLCMLQSYEDYKDNYSLSEALQRIEKLEEDNIVKEDVDGWHNPYLDVLAEELK